MSPYRSLFLRDTFGDLALHFLNKEKIVVVKDIEREDIEVICKTIGTVQNQTSY